MRRNSSLLILSQAILAGGSFLFLLISAHLFPAATVGLATSFVSFGVLVATFTNLGLPNTIVRFLPTSKQKGGLFTASLALVILTSLLGGTVALSLIDHLAPKLSFVYSSAFFITALILLVSGTAVSTLFDSTLMSYRKAEYVLIKACIINVPRIFLPFFVVAAGLKGITGVYVMTLLLGIGFNVFTIFCKLIQEESLKPKLTELIKHKSYAASNYFGGMFGVLPSTLVPIVVLDRLGAANAAYYFLPAQIALFLSVVCGSVSQSLISEASQTNDQARHREAFKKALIQQYQLLTPIIVILAITAWPLLRIYGKSYAAHGFLPLLILLGSGFIVGINWLGDTWLNVNKHSRDYFLMNAFNSLAVVGFVYLFAKYGLTWSAIGWFVGQVLSAVVYLIIFARGQLLDFVGSLKTSS